MGKGSRLTLLWLTHDPTPGSGSFSPGAKGWEMLRRAGGGGEGGGELDEKGRALITPQAGLHSPWGDGGIPVWVALAHPEPRGPGSRPTASPAPRGRERNTGGKRQRQGGIRNQGPREEPGLLQTPPHPLGLWGLVLPPPPPQATPAAGPTRPGKHENSGRPEHAVHTAQFLRAQASPPRGNLFFRGNNSLLSFPFQP